MGGAWMGGEEGKSEEIYKTSLVIRGLGFVSSVGLLGIGILLGWFGAAWTVARHLGAIVPR